MGNPQNTLNSENIQFDKFLLIKKLATGGMGEIYLARTKGISGLDKPCIIKRILPNLAENEEFRVRFIDEAKIIVHLTHGNIVNVFDMGEINGEYFIAMDYIAGWDLREIIKKCRFSHKVIPVELAIYIIIEVGKGLDYAHRKTDEFGADLNIIHRDISPSNILVSIDGEVKIVDFGIAKAAGKSHQSISGMIQGKFSYMSPEQASGTKQIDKRTDIFSLGAVFFELLTTKKLFDGEYDVEILNAVRECSVPDITVHNPAIEKELAGFIRKFLKKEAGERYQKINEAQSDLTRFLFSNKPDTNAHSLSNFLQELFSKDEITMRKRFSRPLSLDEALNLNIDQLSASAPSQFLDKTPSLSSGAFSGPKRDSISKRSAALFPAELGTRTLSFSGQSGPARELSSSLILKPPFSIWNWKLGVFILTLLGLGIFSILFIPGLVDEKRIMIDANIEEARFSIYTKDKQKQKVLYKKYDKLLTPSFINLKTGRTYQVEFDSGEYLVQSGKRTIRVGREHAKDVYRYRLIPRRIALKMVETIKGATIRVNKHVHPEWPVSVDVANLKEGLLISLDIQLKGYQPIQKTLDLSKIEKVLKELPVELELVALGTEKDPVEGDEGTEKRPKDPLAERIEKGETPGKTEKKPPEDPEKKRPEHAFVSFVTEPKDARIQIQVGPNKISGQSAQWLKLPFGFKGAVEFGARGYQSRQLPLDLKENAQLRYPEKIVLKKIETGVLVLKIRPSRPPWATRVIVDQKAYFPQLGMVNIPLSLGTHQITIETEYNGKVFRQQIAAFKADKKGETILSYDFKEQIQ